MATDQLREAPVVSIVIPSARGGDFLQLAVESVQAQDLESWELVIVLDGCDDELLWLGDEDRVRVIRQPRKGVSVARNVGIAAAQSDLIALLDDDDRMLPGRLSAQLALMADERFGLCHTQYREVDEAGAPLRAGGAVGVQYEDLLRGNGNSVLSSVMVRRHLAQEVGGFDPILRLGEDVDFFLKLAACSDIGFLPEVLTEYRRHASNAWSTSTTTGEMKLILRKHLIAAEARGDSVGRDAAKEGLAHLLSGKSVFAMHEARSALERGSYLGVLRGLMEALLSSPRGTLRATARTLRAERAARRGSDAQRSIGAPEPDAD